MTTCDCCNKEVDERSLIQVDKYFVCQECNSYYSEEEIVEQCEKKTDCFSEIKDAIKSGKTVYWRSQFYPVRLNKSGDLYIMAQNGNMQYVTPDYKAEDFKIEGSK